MNNFYESFFAILVFYVYFCRKFLNMNKNLLVVYHYVNVMVVDGTNKDDSVCVFNLFDDKKRDVVTERKLRPATIQDIITYRRPSIFCHYESNDDGSVSYSDNLEDELLLSYFEGKPFYYYDDDPFDGLMDNSAYYVKYDKDKKSMTIHNVEQNVVAQFRVD